MGRLGSGAQLNSITARHQGDEITISGQPELPAARSSWSPQPQGVAVANDAVSDGSATQARLRLTPRIAPVTFRTRPDGQDAVWTSATSYGASISGSDFRMVWAEHGNAAADNNSTDTKIRMWDNPSNRRSHNSGWWRKFHEALKNFLHRVSESETTARLTGDSKTPASMRGRFESMAPPYGRLSGA